jgi:hypothetical protein
MWQAIKANAAKYFPGWSYHRIVKNLGVEGRIHPTGTTYPGIPLNVAYDVTMLSMTPDGNSLVNPRGERNVIEAYVPMYWFSDRTQRNDRSVFSPSMDDYLISGTESFRIFNIIPIGLKADCYYFVLRREEIFA